MKKLIFGTIGIVSLVGLFSFTVLNRNDFEISRNLDIFTTLFRELNTNYVDELSSEKLVKDGMDAMLSSLDPYTTYIPESKSDEYLTAHTGEYGGIGAVVGKRDGVNTVIMPYIGFPAHAAGLLIGDQILKIDQQELEDKTSSQISELLKGQPGSGIELTIKRLGQDSSINIPLVRDKIVISNVMYFGMYDEQVGVIRLSDFTTNASTEVKSALDSLKRLGAEKIILDLRGNPGGLLDEAIKVANVFVSQGEEVVSTKGKLTAWNKTYKTQYPATDENIPLAILTSSATASAAEIVSGVVQDYDRGILVGKRTFGKGLVQSTRPLPYNAQLKITTAKYYIPSGRCIQAIDYSKRNEDGSVGKIPDSLMVAFKTKNGRVVYDGGGIDPDLQVEPKKYSNLLYNLVSQNLIFDYASQYAVAHQSIAAPREFTLSDKEYQEFVDWVNGKDVSLSLQMDNAIVALEKMAKEEKYYDGMQQTIDALKDKVSALKNDYLSTSEDEIRTMLEEDIVSRYYFHTGMLAAALDDDEEMAVAAEILNDPARYQKLLTK